MVAVHLALGGFRGECTTLHFACRVAVQTAMNARRKAGYRMRHTPSAAPLDLADLARDDRSPAQSIEAARRREALRQLLCELPEVQAEVLALHTLLGYTVEETADATGVPVNTVRSRLRNATREAARASARRRGAARRARGGRMSPRDPFGIDPGRPRRARATRAARSRAEQRELERATEASPTLRIAYEVGRDMDAATAVRGGDDALIARAASAALARVTDASRQASTCEQLRQRAVSGWIGGRCDRAVRAVGERHGRGAVERHGRRGRSAHERERADAQDEPARRARTRDAPRDAAREASRGATAEPQRSRRRDGRLAVAADEAERAPALRVRAATARPSCSTRPTPRGAAATSRAPRGSTPSCARAIPTRTRAASRASRSASCCSRAGTPRPPEREFRRYLARGRGQLVEEALVGQAQSLRRMGTDARRTREPAASARGPPGAACTPRRRAHGSKTLEGARRPPRVERVASVRSSRAGRALRAVDRGRAAPASRGRPGCERRAGGDARWWC